MSMVFINSEVSDHGFYSNLLSRFVQERRRKLSLSTAQAAELSGMQVSEWIALEAGWVPREISTVRAVSEALRVRTSDLNFMALLSACAQESTAH